VRILLSLAGLILSVACTTITPASFSAKPPEVGSMSGGPVAVTGEHAQPASWRFHAAGVAYEYDRNAFSDELARLVAQSLSRAGAVIGAGGGSIAVRVIYLDFLFQGPCIVDYAVRYGDDDTWTGGQTQYDSASFATACREALEQAAAEIAAARRTRDYVGGP
jgi:hypothetical protein